MNSQQSLEYWVIPPETDAEFVACMEEVLDTYELPYDPLRPMVCMDEQPVSLCFANPWQAGAKPQHAISGPKPTGP
jgi:hypothetical protein